MGVKSNITTPLRKETYKNLQLNAGVFLYDFDLSSYDSADELKTAIAAAVLADTNILGATRGGGTFTITRDIRRVDADGTRFGFVGSEIVDSADAYLSTTLIEVTPAHLKSVIGNADLDTTASLVTKVTLRTAFEDEDYLENLVWVGDTSEGYMAIELKNALNTADITFTFADKNEGTVNAEYHAHQAEVDDYDELPVTLYFFDPETTQSNSTPSGGGSGSGTGTGT